MSKRTRELEAPQGGMSLSMRLTLVMSLALAAVMSLGGVALFKSASRLTSTVHESTLFEAVRLTGENQLVIGELRRLAAERDLLASIEKSVGEVNPTTPELSKLKSDLRAMRAERATRMGEVE